MAKIVIIGAGHVGSHCAYALAIQNLVDEIVLLDLDAAKATSQAEDIADGMICIPRAAQVRSGGYADCSDADIAVIAAGAPRTPVQMPDGRFVPPPRLTLMAESVRTMQDIVPQLMASGFDGIIIGITNPADVIIHYVFSQAGLPAGRVFGTGTGLDTVRLRRCLAAAAGITAGRISCLAMGEHGDSQIAPLSQIFIDGEPLAGKMPALDWQEAARLARSTGGRVIAGKGSTEFGIGTVLADLVRAVIGNERRVLTVSALLTGQYGIDGLHAGVPAVIGRRGVEDVVELPLAPDELAGFQASCAVIRSYVDQAAALG